MLSRGFIPYGAAAWVAVSGVGLPVGVTSGMLVCLGAPVPATVDSCGGGGSMELLDICGRQWCSPSSAIFVQTSGVCCAGTWNTFPSR